LNKDFNRPAPLKNQSFRKKIAYILFFAAVILILLNLVINKIFPVNVKENKELTADVIDKKFRTAVFSFGLEPEWVKKIKLKRSDPLCTSYRIDIPADLPVTVILREINEFVKHDYVQVRSEEEKINGKTRLIIYSNNLIKLTAEFRYNPDLKRNAGEISFLLQDGLTLNEKEDSVFLNSPELFIVVLIPSKSSANEAVKISKYGKEYALLLNDEIPDLKYNFKVGYSPARLRASVREILTDFPDVQFFIEDENSSLYSSAVFPFVKKEFTKRKFIFYKKSSFDLIEGAEPQDVFSKFKNIADSKEKINILTSVHNYFLLQPEILKYKKIGCKFVSPVLK